MKLKVSIQLTEQNNCGNTHRKYIIRGFNGHLPYAVGVAGVLFFVLLMRWLFENKRETKIKLKVSGESTEQKNGGSADRKYAIRGSNGTYPLLLLLLVFSFLCCCCGDFLNKNSTPRFLTQNQRAYLYGT